MVAWLTRLHQLEAEQAACAADPFLGVVEPIIRGMDAISTHSLLDLLDLPKTTGNARRIALTMRSLGFIPIKSRRLMPGGYRDTVTRGWARPVRELGYRATLKQGEKVRSLHVNTPLVGGAR